MVNANTMFWVIVFRRVSVVLLNTAKSYMTSGKRGLTSVIFRHIFCAYTFVDISLIRTEELEYRGSQTLVLSE